MRKWKIALGTAVALGAISVASVHFLDMGNLSLNAGTAAATPAPAAFVMPVPFMANTLSDRQVLLSQHGIADAFDLAGGSDLMVVGIGTTDPDASLVIGGMIEPAEIDELRRAGAAGEMLGHYFNHDGNPVETELTRRIITLPFERLRNRRIVAIAGGAMKVAAIRAVLASGLLTGLITDERTARAIVDTARDEADDRGQPQALPNSRQPELDR